MNLSTEEIILVSDKVFINHCYSEYKLSEKTYGEIDLFFYRYGIEERKERRRHLLAFLRYNEIKEMSNQTYLTAGNLKLKQEIEEYLEEPYVLLHMREKAI